VRGRGQQVHQQIFYDREPGGGFQPNLGRSNEGPASQSLPPVDDHPAAGADAQFAVMSGMGEARILPGYGSEKVQNGGALLHLCLVLRPMGRTAGVLSKNAATHFHGHTFLLSPEPRWRRETDILLPCP
jgi:hypothetical protein